MVFDLCSIQEILASATAEVKTVEVKKDEEKKDEEKKVRTMSIVN